MEKKEKIQLLYEVAEDMHYHELGFLFQRLNFFLVSMSFLVVAFVMAYYTKEAKNDGITRALVSLGLITSLIFTFVNFWNSENIIKKLRDYILKKEGEIKGLPNEKIEGPLTTVTASFKDKKLIWKFPALITWSIPLISFAFWLSVLCILLNNPRWGILGISMVVGFLGILCISSKHVRAFLKNE